MTSSNPVLVYFRNPKLGILWRRSIRKCCAFINFILYLKLLWSNNRLITIIICNLCIISYVMLCFISNCLLQLCLSCWSQRHPKHKPCICCWTGYVISFIFFLQTWFYLISHFFTHTLHANLMIFHCTSIRCKRESKLSRIINNVCWFFWVFIWREPWVITGTKRMFLLCLIFAEALCDHVSLQRMCQDNHSGYPTVFSVVYATVWLSLMQ